jgi:hypothetical protein
LLLGREVAEDESVSVKSIRPGNIVDPGLSPEQRRNAMEQLNGYFAKVDAGRKPVSVEEEEAIINEALRSARPNYRPIL